MKQTSIFRTLLALALTGLMATACTDDLHTPQDNNPLPPLPPGAIALSLTPDALKPAFDERQPGTRAATAPTVPGGDQDRTQAEKDAAQQWQEGDELLMTLNLYPTTDGGPNYIVYTTLRYSNNSGGTWTAEADKGYVRYLEPGASSSTRATLAQKPVLITHPTTGSLIGIRPPVGGSSASWAKASIYLYYTPGTEWKPSGTSGVSRALKAGTPAGTVQRWLATQLNVPATNGGFAFNFKQSDDTPIAFDPHGSRLRIYTGRSGDEVKMVSGNGNYTPSVGGQTPDHTYTATTDARGNAYFYGEFLSGNTATISLPAVQLPGQAPKAVEAYSGKLEILQSDGTTANGLTTALDASFGLNAAAMCTQVFHPASQYAGKYQDFVDALKAAADKGNTIWQVMGAENTQLDGSDASKTVMGAIKEALLSYNTGSDATADASLRIHLYMPQFTAEVPASTFNSRRALEKAVLPAATTLGNTVFNGCTNLQSVSLPAATTLGSDVFNSCTNLTSVSLPAATTLGNNVFKGCTNLTSVSLPAATKLGNSVFSGCTNLTSVSLPAATTLGSNVFNSCTSLTSVSLPAATTLGSGVFQGCTNLTSVSLPAATKLDSSVFLSCTNLTSVNLPAATTLGSGVFQSCTSLTSVSLPAATKLGDTVFQSCTNLTSVSLPAATKLGSNVFYGCTNLTSIDLTQPGAWVGMDYSLFVGFSPTAACTVSLAQSSYNTLGKDGKSWAPTKAGGGSALLSGTSYTDYTTFVSSSDAVSKPQYKVHQNITFVAP